MAVVMVAQPGLQYGTYYSATKSGPGSPMGRLVIIGVIVAVLLGVGLLVLTLLNGNTRNDLTLLAVRENSLLTLANSSSVSIRNPDLATANSNATILLTSDVASMISNTGIKKLPPDLVKKEADTNGDNLKQASLLDKFDITYRKIVLQKVEALIAEAQTVRTTLSSKATKALVDHAILNLQSIDKQFTQVQL
jgi:hypothetical protein